MRFFGRNIRNRASGPKRNRVSRAERRGHNTLAVENLEHRNLLSASTVVASTAIVISPLAKASTPVGYSPAQLRTAYGFTGLTFNGGKAANGSGETIAIVDAYNDPNIAKDLAAFDTEYGLAAANLTVVSQTGGSVASLSTDAGWALETSLDVEWAHAIAPGAKILLVEAKSDSLNDLLTAVDYAKVQTGVVTVSMSWGSSEFSGETAYDSTFVEKGVTFVASSGDSGSPPSWPGVSPNVLSVGGTTLKLSSSGAFSSETAWSDSTGGLSSYESEPAFQSEDIKTAFGARANPDVAYDANPNTGVSVYDSVAYDGQSGWWEVGGTSAGAPQWAALIAIADQGRSYAGLSALTSGGSLTEAQGGTQASIYNLSAADFHDITSGSNGGYSAGAGYDGVTGLGSPLAGLVIEDLATGINGTGSPVSTSFGLTGGGSTRGGSGGARGGGGGGRFGGHGSGRFVDVAGRAADFSASTMNSLGETVSSNSSSTTTTVARSAGSASVRTSENSQSIATEPHSNGPAIPDDADKQAFERLELDAADQSAFRQADLQAPDRIELAPQMVDLVLGGADDSLVRAAGEHPAGIEAAIARTAIAGSPTELNAAAVGLAALAILLEPRVNWRFEQRFDTLRGRR